MVFKINHIEMGSESRTTCLKRLNDMTKSCIKGSTLCLVKDVAKDCVERSTPCLVKDVAEDFVEGSTPCLKYLDDMKKSHMERYVDNSEYKSLERCTNDVQYESEQKSLECSASHRPMDDMTKSCKSGTTCL